MEYSPVTIILPLLWVLSPLLLILLVAIAYEIKKAKEGKSKYGFFRRIIDRFAGPVRTLSYISERGPKFIYLDDFVFEMENRYGPTKLSLKSLAGGEEIRNEFQGNTPSECLLLFFDWYDKNRETLIDAKESLAKIKRLKRSLN